MEALELTTHLNLRLHRHSSTLSTTCMHRSIQEHSNHKSADLLATESTLRSSTQSWARRLKSILIMLRAILLHSPVKQCPMGEEVAVMSSLKRRQAARIQERPNNTQAAFLVQNYFTQVALMVALERREASSRRALFYKKAPRKATLISFIWRREA